jgi:hypothetical protein
MSGIGCSTIKSGQVAYWPHPRYKWCSVVRCFKPRIGYQGTLSTMTLGRAVYSSEIDLIPDQEAKTLTVRLHPLANTSSD